nr:MAG TPA: hypothetical protein [Caudoviricetes sp.]
MRNFIIKFAFDAINFNATSLDNLLRLMQHESNCRMKGN